MQYEQHGATQDTPAAKLEARWRHFGIHRASRAAAIQTCSTGWGWLDALLPGGGYPLAAITEFLVEHPGQGELSLLLAALEPRLASDPGARLVFVEPPYRLNAPALDAAGIDRSRVPVICCRDTAERLWSIEQLAAVGGFVAFVLWDNGLDAPALRRLQLASEKAGCPVFVYRDLTWARHHSPAALRLAVRCRKGRQHLEILKCRGPAGGRAAGLSAARDKGWAYSPVAPDPHRLVSDKPANQATDPPATRTGGATAHRTVTNQDISRCSHHR